MGALVEEGRLSNKGRLFILKTKVIIYIGLSLFLVVLAVLYLTGNFPPNYGSVGNPTAKEILKGNPDADILKLDGLIY